MLQSLLKSMLADGVSEFAVSPTPITDDQPYAFRDRRPHSPSLRSCPIGLSRAVVLDTKAHWEEDYRTGCGESLTSHKITHKNGVLVALPDFDLGPAERKKFLKQPTAGYQPDGTLTLIISHKAVYSDWASYAPVQATRDRLERESKARYAELDAVADRLGVPRDSHRRLEIDAHRLDRKRHPHEAKKFIANADWVGERRYWSGDVTEEAAFNGFITIPYALARELATALETAKEMLREREASA